MATTPELHEPQIAAARAQAWHQASDGEGSTSALLTLDAARTFLEQYGLLLFAPRPLGAPAPSLVEATLGLNKPATAPAEAETARGLVARLVGEGSAVPLNLLGGGGDTPDFVVSASAFPFVFTLRGDKGWKRPPETSGAVKVTPLALRAYELLAERGAMTVAALVPEIGREVTDSAIARALHELWSLLRVIPVLQQGEGETLWELTTARFVKAVKAGANAGQPTALSALISLYLGQSLVASEEEIASFLSPLTARSRVRDVLHGLVAGRQLSETVIEGKTVLYIPDALPDFAASAVSPEVESEATGEQPIEGTSEGAPARERIRRFDAGSAGDSRPKKLRGKPAPREAGPRPSKPGFAKRPGTRPAREGFAPRADRPRRDREQGGDARPARGEGADRPSFARPWDEERGARPDGAERRPRREAAGPPSESRRPPRRDEGAGGERRPFQRDRPTGEARPFRPRPEGGGRPAPRREGAGDKPYVRRDSGDRPFPRREAGGDRPFRPREGGATDRAPFRRDREGAEARPARPRPSSPGAPRPYAPARPRPFAPDRPDRGGAEGGPRAPRPGGGGFRARPDREGRDGGGQDRGEGRAPGRPPFKRAGGPPRQGAQGGFDRPRGPRDTGGEGRPPAGGRAFGRGAQGRPPARDGERRSFGARAPGGAGGAGRERPGGGFRPSTGDRPRGGPGQGPAGRGGPGFGGKSGSFTRGPAKGAGRPAPRPGSRPGARPKPEDEA